MHLKLMVIGDAIDAKPQTQIHCPNCEARMFDFNVRIDVEVERDTPSSITEIMLKDKCWRCGAKIGIIYEEG